MSLIARKIAAFAKKVADLADRPGGTIPTAELKVQFDSSPEELRVAHNGLVDDLTATTEGASGAHQVGSAAITGVTGANVHAQLTSLKTQVNDAVTGILPDGSIAEQKLAFIPATKPYVDTNFKQKHQLSADNGTAIFIGTTDVNTLMNTGVYAVFSNSTNIPTPHDYFLEVFKYNDLNVLQQGFNFGANSLYQRRLIDNEWTPWSVDLFTSVDSGKTDIKTAIIGKGGTVAGTSPHSFAELVAGVNSIATGKKVLSGSGTVDASGNVAVSGIGFTPGTIIVQASTATNTTYRKVHAFVGVSGSVDMNQTTYWGNNGYGAISQVAFTIGAGSFNGILHASVASRPFSWFVVEA